MTFKLCQKGDIRTIAIFNDGRETARVVGAQPAVAIEAVVSRRAYA